MASARAIVAGLRSEAEFIDLLRACAWEYSGSHVQAHQATAVARFLDVDESTVRRWLDGITTPKARDVWPLIICVVLAQQPVRDQGAFVAAITGLVEG